MPPRTPTSLRSLRQFRSFRDKDCTISSAVGALRKDVERQHRLVDGAGDAWTVVVPRHLAVNAEVQKLSRGLLTVKVRDAAGRFALDRFLRSGGEQALISVSKAKIKRVKLV